MLNYNEGPDCRSVTGLVDQLTAQLKLKGYLKIGGSWVCVSPLLNCHTVVSCLFQRCLVPVQHQVVNTTGAAEQA